MPSTASDALTGVALSFPSLISLAKSEDKSPRSWIQLARTGSFKSRRYGDFSITKTDLTEMLHNFKHVTPAAPTELPVDYDHLSMDPKKPGDGKAAGWFKDLQLRGDGDELWGEVEWTPDGADHVRNGEYRFVSPSFVKNHTHKDGKKIGTTLLAAAITNHPFLEGMAALTLYSLSAMGDLALVDEPTPIHLAELGQRVMLAPGNARTQDEIGATFEIAEVIGDGDDQFVSVKDANGMIHKWFRRTELLPASAVPANPQHPALQAGAAPVVPAQAATAAVPGMQSVPPAADPAAAAAAAAAAGLDPAAAAAAAAAGAPAAGAPVPGAPVDPLATAKMTTPTPGMPPAVGATDKVTDKNAPGGVPDEKSDAEKKADDKDNDGATGGEGVAAEEAEAAEAEADGDAAAAMAGKVVKKGAVPAAPGKDGAENLEKLKKTSDTVEPEEDDEVALAIQKAIAAALASGQTPQRGMLNMKFMLNNDKGEPMELTTEQLEKAGIKVVPEGSVAVPQAALDGLKSEVTNLSERLSSAEKARVQTEFVTELNRLKSGAFITGAQEEFAKQMWGDTLDLSAFKSWAATFTTPLVSLNREHGSSADGESAKTAGEQAAEKIITLSAQIAKERGINLSEATKIAAGQLQGEADAYRESFAEV